MELQRQTERDRFSAKMAFARCVFKCLCVCATHSLSGKLRNVVIDIQQAYDSSGGVGQTICGVSLHIGSLNDQGVLRDLLLGTKKNKKNRVKNSSGSQLDVEYGKRYVCRAAK